MWESCLRQECGELAQPQSCWELNKEWESEKCGAPGWAGMSLCVLPEPRPSVVLEGHNVSGKVKGAQIPDPSEEAADCSRAASKQTPAWGDYSMDTQVQPHLALLQHPPNTHTHTHSAQASYNSGPRGDQADSKLLSPS